MKSAFCSLPAEKAQSLKSTGFPHFLWFGERWMLWALETWWGLQVGPSAFPWLSKFEQDSFSTPPPQSALAHSVCIIIFSSFSSSQYPFELMFSFRFYISMAASHWPAAKLCQELFSPQPSHEWCDFAIALLSSARLDSSHDVSSFKGYPSQWIFLKPSQHFVMAESCMCYLKVSFKTSQK